MSELGPIPVAHPELTKQTQPCAILKAGFMVTLRFPRVTLTESNFHYINSKSQVSPNNLTVICLSAVP